MAGAYIRFSVNGIKHSSFSGTRKDISMTMDEWHYSIQRYGFIESERLSNLNTGDVIQMEMIHKTKGRDRITKKMLSFTITNFVQVHLNYIKQCRVFVNLMSSSGI